MAREEPDDGPLFVWNFPLLRMAQNRNGILQTGLGNIIQGNVMEDEPSEPQGDFGQSAETAEVTDVTDDEVLDGIEDSISELEEGSPLDDEPDRTVDITSSGFEPETISIGIGDTVEWINNTDTTARVSSIEGAFTSSIIDPDGSYQETFYTPGTVTYKDPTTGDSERGDILVGPDTEESDVDPVPFDSEEDLTSVKSMDEAAQEKQDQNSGFDT